MRSKMASVYKRRLALSASYYNKDDDDDALFKIDDFEISAILGRGSFGKVALGHHRVTGRTFALKYVPRRDRKPMPEGYVVEGS